MARVAVGPFSQSPAGSLYTDDPARRHSGRGHRARRPAAGSRTSSAAHAILLQLWSLVSYAVDGFAYATETTVGMWLGRGNEARAQASAGAALLWGVGAGTLFAMAYMVGVDAIVKLFTTDAHVQEIIRDLVWMIAFSQPVNALAYIFDGILIGATDTSYLSRAMFLSSVVFTLVVALGWSVWGLSLALVWWSAVVLWRCGR